MRYTHLLPALCAIPAALGIKLDVTSDASIKSAAKEIATKMLTNYTGVSQAPNYVYLSGVPGLLPQAPLKYYWWESGEMFMALIDYWFYTNDTTWNSLVMDGMLFQIGSNQAFMPLNQTKDLGNHAFAALAAAENKFPDPPAGQPGWIALAQAVYNTQVARWDPTTCGGGLRWQIYPFNPGYDYKNSASNLGLFNLAARLGAYTHNQTYFDWAEKMYDWSASINLVSTKGEVFDGSDDLLNCTELDHVQWTYTAGMTLHGAAVMYANTNNTKWLDRVNTLWSMTKQTFFDNNKVMSESACEKNTPVNCNLDQTSFKSSLSRFLAMTTKYVPSLSSEIMSYLAASASAAAAQCIGADDHTATGDLCGTLWFNNGAWDGTTGVGQQMSALQIVAGNLVKNTAALVTNGTGGTSIGNADAGLSSGNPLVQYAPITTADRAGAGILTAIVIVSTLSLIWFACH